MTTHHTTDHITDHTPDHTPDRDQVTRTRSRGPRRTRSRTIATTGAIVFVGATVALGAIALSDDHPVQRPEQPASTAPQRSTRDTRRDLVERGLIPRESLEPAPLWHTELVRELAERDLVERGLIPPQSLDPAPTLAPPAG